MKANYKASMRPKQENVYHYNLGKKNVKNLNKQVKRTQKARIISNYKRAK